MDRIRVVCIRSFLWLVAVLFPALFFSATSRAGTLSEGDRIRVQFAGGHMEGKLVSADKETLTIQTASAETPIRKDAVQKISILDGTRRHWGEGLLIGAAAGAAVGGIGAASSNEDWADAGMVGGCTIIGAVSGTIVGALIKTDYWANVPLGSLQVGVSPVDHSGASLSLTWNF